MEAPDMDAIKRAEDALADLQGDMQKWLQEELTRLDAAQAGHTANPNDAESRANLYAVAHDLKGLGATYGFPLVGRVAGSQCEMMTGLGKTKPLPASLTKAHVDTIHAMVNGKITSETDETGIALCTELEHQVANELARNV